MNILRRATYGATLNEVITRLMTALILTCAGELLLIPASFNTFDYFNALGLLPHMLVIAAVFVALTLLRRPRLDHALLLAGSLLYASLAVYQRRDDTFAIACCLVAGGIAVYCAGKTYGLAPSGTTVKIITALLAALAAGFMGYITVARYLSYQTYNFDFGLFSQMYHHMREAFTPMVTSERDRLLNHFAVHFSPIFYILLPFYYILPSPVTLLVGQAVLLASGVIPLLLLGKRFKLSNTVLLLLAVVYAFSPAILRGTLHYYFHENKFLLPLLLWLFYFTETKKPVPTALFALLVLFVKEDAPVYVACFGLYMILSTKNVKWGIIMLGGAMAYFLCVTELMKQYGLGISSYRYDNYMYDGSDSLVTVIKAVLLNPIYALSESFQQDKMAFFFQMLAPLCFLPLMIQRPANLILLIPPLLLTMMSSYPHQSNTLHQYTYGPNAFLFYLALLNAAALTPAVRKRVALVAAMSSVIFFSSLVAPTLPSTARSYAEQRPVTQTIRAALDTVPDDASVAASTRFIANLSRRDTLYELGRTEQTAEYVVIDLRPGHYNEEQEAIETFHEAGYEQLLLEEDIIAIFRDTTYQEP